MSAPIICTDPARRAAVRERGLAGLDTVSVGEDGLTLAVVLFGAAPEGLDRHSFRVEGGQRVTGIKVLAVEPPTSQREDVELRLRLRLNRVGDGSTYRLHALGPDFDPRYAVREFSFRQHCAQDLDCLAADDCPPPESPEPVVDYLAKDYGSFRRLLFERLTLTMPEWTERHAPDLGVTLVELLAYAGDRLSYLQDAVATEAYLETARLRTSVRRHARLVDYPMHDGCAARTFVCVSVDQRIALPRADIRFLSFPPGVLPQTGPALTPQDLPPERNPGVDHPVFEPLPGPQLVLDPAHNEIALWAWGDQDCCLPVGATSATLADAWADKKHVRRTLGLVPGDVLIFEEVLGPQTHAAADADPTHRQAVRLTKVTPGLDALYGQPVLEVAWAVEDALGFPLCVSSRGGPDCAERPVSVARGNTVLVEHGATLSWCAGLPEEIPVPGAAATETGCPDPTDFGCPDTEPSRRPGYPALPVRFRPALAHRPVTWSAPYPRPADLAEAQARALAELPHAARARLRALRAGPGPLTPADRAWLTVLFGAETLQRLGIEEHPRRAVSTLLARFDKLLAAKLARLRTLIRRARAGYVLEAEGTDWELLTTWGEEAAEALAPGNPALHGPAGQALRPDAREALPAVRLRESDAGPAAQPWLPLRDLLRSGPRDRRFVGETDDDGVLTLRFGDGRTGAVPAAGGTLLADYRIGNGTAGNVGREAVNRIVLCTTRTSAVTGVRNPLPATGGTDPEPLADVRAAAPHAAFGRLLRAVTAEDYATLASALPWVRRAAAELRWTGSWYEAAVAVQPADGAPPDLTEQTRQALHPYRRIGHGLSVSRAVEIPLDVALDVTVQPDHVAGHVRAAVLRALLPGRRRDGGCGFFDPAGLGFGTPVRLSALIAAAAGVPGVLHVEATRLRRLFGADPDLPVDGMLRVGPLAIARLDGDLAHPEHGRLALNLRGGR